MKSRLIQGLSIALLVVLGGPRLTQAQAPAPQGCGAQTLNGSYAFKNTGTFPDGSSSVFVGVQVFDGVGTAWASNTGSIGGFIIKGSNTVAYTVNKDCTGTMTVVFPTFTVHWDIVVADNGKKILGIIADSGWVFSAEFTKQ